MWFGSLDPDHEFIVGEGHREHALGECASSAPQPVARPCRQVGIRALILPPEARRVRIFADHDELGQGIAAAREAAGAGVLKDATVAVSIVAHGRRRRQRCLAEAKADE